ncbi:phosphorylase, Pnp/Udp family [Streptococcus infantis SK1302]|uniref:Phosphorylase, Pnp/Udp family n=1 Tax=Streptococcus infantis SK1302 TaxID=871237 RepID=A0ABP2J2Z3_9STRE|nr:phosphorylase, Pnp/Udp family [Streptococcus infantis SK1302]
MEKALDKAGIEHIRTKSWTTDAFYRETAAKVKRRLAAGARVEIWKLQLSWPGPNID